MSAEFVDTNILIYAPRPKRGFEIRAIDRVGGEAE